MIHKTLCIILFIPLLLLAACQNSSPPASGDPAIVGLSQGYGLLYSTIREECDVDKVLIIKKPAASVAELIKTISRFSRDSKSMLEVLAKDDPTIGLDNQGLPQVETKTREAISSATSKQILFHGGRELEFRLLLTQHEALNYITHLALMVADQDSRENRKRYLKQLSEQSAALHEQVLAQLMGPYVGSSK